MDESHGTRRRRRPEGRGIAHSSESRGVGAMEKGTVLLLSGRLIVLYTQMSLFLDAENTLRHVDKTLCVM